MSSFNFMVGYLMSPDRIGNVYYSKYLDIAVLYDIHGNLTNLNADEKWK